MVEGYGAYIVQVAIEKASTGLVAPNFDLVIVPSGNKERLSPMKMDPSNGSIICDSLRAGS